MQKFIIKNTIKQDLEELRNEDFVKFITKSNQAEENVASDTAKIIEDVKQNGDQALIKYANKFDQTNFKKPQELLVSKSEIAKACKNLDKDIKKSLDLAYTRIKDYHKKQLPKDFTYTDKIGIKLGNIWKNIEKIGIYTPGGTASYPSSVLMSSVPAITAGVKNIVMCAPTSKGKINPAVLYAAKICGIKEIYKVGGASAIAALTYSTDIVKRVNKIVGPGNAYVAEAKRTLFGEVGIDMIAGPTDITIITDKNSNPSWIAADALSQLEHGPDSKAFIITNNEEFADKIIKSMKDLSKNLSRKEIIDKSIKNSAIFVIKNLNDASRIVNFIAPEHLEIATKSPEKFVKKIQNAGAIFLGNYAPESLGDYIAGPSHTLPTNSSAKFSSGLSVYDFLKRISIISADEKSFKKLAKQTSLLAECEGLDAHKLSVDIRND